MQNTVNTSASQQVQLSSSIGSQLDNIIKSLNTNFDDIDKDLKKSFYDPKLIYNTVETRHLALEHRFASIKVQVVRLGMQPLASIVQSPQPCHIQQQPIPLPKQGATAVEPPPPPVLPTSRYVHNVILSLLLK